MVESMLHAGAKGVHALRDATRGGVASVLNEMAQAASLGMIIDQTQIPVREDVQGACEILGLDPLYVANEGKLVAFVSPEVSETVLDVMRMDAMGADARIIGEVTDRHPRVVRMRTSLGGSRVVEMMSGEQLPRIC
jgi:hydrogenase expression/formation protein HypE